jgi:hypothetical protein
LRGASGSKNGLASDRKSSEICQSEGPVAAVRGCPMTDSAPSRPDASRWTMIFALIGLALPLLLGGVYLARRPLLHWAMKKNNWFLVKTIIKFAPEIAIEETDFDASEIDIYSYSGKLSPVFLALHYKDEEFLDFIIDKNESIKKSDILNWAIKNKRSDWFDLLLARGVQVKQEQIIWPVLDSSVDIVEKILNNCNFSLSQLNLALQEAVGILSTELYLLSIDDDSEDYDYELNNIDRQMMIIKLLIKRGADLGVLSPEDRARVEEILAQEHAQASPSASPNQEPKTAN